MVTLNNDAVTDFIYCKELLGKMSDVARGPIVLYTLMHTFVDLRNSWTFSSICALRY